MKVEKSAIADAVFMASQYRRFHPVAEYLADKVWDGKPRVEDFFVRHLGAEDNAYTREACKKWLMAAITRVFEPGHKFDFAVILEGVQGIGKSTLIRILSLGFFNELTGDLGNTQKMVEAMHGFWILELSELSGMNRTRVEEVKGFIAAQSDRVRLAYRADPEDFERNCVFMGSTNKDQYLKDASGARRFWPIKCSPEAIDQAVVKAELGQLWAEALHLYREARKARPHGSLALHLESPEAQAIALGQQEERYIETMDDTYGAQMQAWVDTLCMESDIEVRQRNHSDRMDAADPNVQMGRRNLFHAQQFWTQCLGRDLKDISNVTLQQLAAAAGSLEGWARVGKRRFQDKGPGGRPRHSLGHTLALRASKALKSSSTATTNAGLRYPRGPIKTPRLTTCWGDRASPIQCLKPSTVALRAFSFFCWPDFRPLCVDKFGAFRNTFQTGTGCIWFPRQTENGRS